MYLLKVCTTAELDSVDINPIIGVIKDIVAFNLSRETILDTIKASIANCDKHKTFYIEIKDNNVMCIPNLNSGIIVNDIVMEWIYVKDNKKRIYLET